MGTAVFVFKNNAPNSASAADDIPLRIIVKIFSTAPLFGEMLLSVLAIEANSLTTGNMILRMEINWQCFIR